MKGMVRLLAASFVFLLAGALIPLLLIMPAAADPPVFLPLLLRAYGPAGPTPTATATRTASPTSTPTVSGTATATATPPAGVVPQPGHWTGTTSMGRPVSYEVSIDSTQWMSYTLATRFVASTCGGANVDMSIGVNGPGPIVAGHFERQISGYAFDGDFSDAEHAAGSFAFTNYQVVVGLPYPPFVCYYYLNQSGTWTAQAP